MASEIIGRVMMTFRGEYSATERYTYLDSVLYKGSSYVCKVDATGIEPTDTTHWQMIASKGDVGTLAGSAMSIDTEKGTIAFNSKMADPANSQAKEEVPYTFTIDGKGLSYTIGDKTTQLVTIPKSDETQHNKIDQSNTETNKTPSDYSDGVFYEAKTVTAVGIDRDGYADDVKTGTNGILTTKVVTINNQKYARQTFELLDNTYPLTLERNGAGDSWNDWHGVTNWN